MIRRTQLVATCLYLSGLAERVHSYKDNDDYYGAGRDDERFTWNEWSDWVELLVFLLCLSIVIFVLHIFTYCHLATYFYLKRYKNADHVEGEVLACRQIVADEESISSCNTLEKKYEVEAIYSLLVAEWVPRVGSYDEEEYSRWSEISFRTERKVIVRREFLRRFPTDKRRTIGSKVDFLVLKNVERSACTQEEISTRNKEHSRIRTLVIFVPGLLASIVFIILACMKIHNFDTTEEQRFGCIILILCFLVSMLVSRYIFDKQFQAEKEEMFLSAIPKQQRSPSQRTTKQRSNRKPRTSESSSDDGKTKRLLHSDHL